MRCLGKVQSYGKASGGIYNSHEMVEYYEQTLKKMDKGARLVLFLGVFENCEKRLLASSCLSVSAYAWNNSAYAERVFIKLVFECSRKSVEKIQVSLKSNKNNGYVTWRPKDIYDHISLTSSWIEEFF